MEFRGVSIRHATGVMSIQWFSAPGMAATRTRLLRGPPANGWALPASAASLPAYSRKSESSSSGALSQPWQVAVLAAASAVICIALGGALLALIMYRRRARRRMAGARSLSCKSCGEAEIASASHRALQLVGTGAGGACLGKGCNLPTTLSAYPSTPSASAHRMGAECVSKAQTAEETLVGEEADPLTQIMAELSTQINAQRQQNVARHLSLPVPCGLQGDSGPEGVVLEELLGTGSYGRVYRALWHGSTVAVKSMLLPASMSGRERREKMVGEGPGHLGHHMGQVAAVSASRRAGGAHGAVLLFGPLVALLQPHGLCVKHLGCRRARG